jgi:hypothetical protein
VKRFALTIMPFILQAYAHGASLDRCPILPKRSELRWHFVHDKHLDVDICYATARGSDAQILGFYFSQHAAGFIGDPDPIGPGTVAGHEVMWFGRGSNFNVGSFSRHATITPDALSGEFVLVWLYQTQLETRLETLRKVKMRAVDAP